MSVADSDAATLSYAGNLPLAWRPLADDEPAQGFEHENLSTLFAVAALEDHRELPNDDGPLQQEILRLHQKVDLLVNMLSSLIRAQAQLPPSRPLQLSARRVIWRGDATPPPLNARILVEIHLHRGLAQPLRLPARVVAAADAGDAEAAFEPLGEAVLAALERHIFLHHRRSIAGARHQSTSR